MQYHFIFPLVFTFFLITNILKASISLVGQDAFLFLQLSNTSPMEITARITKPNGQSEDIEMRDLGNNFYQLKFKPQMEGAHAVSVYHREQHVAGEKFSSLHFLKKVGF